jgi:hypothetical protein
MLPMRDAPYQQTEPAKIYNALAEERAGKSNPLINLPLLHRYVDLAGILE